MNTEELLVHDSSEGEAVKRVHTSVVHRLCVLDLACVCVGGVECVRGVRVWGGGYERTSYRCICTVLYTIENYMCSP